MGGVGADRGLEWYRDWGWDCPDWPGLGAGCWGAGWLPVGVLEGWGWCMDPAWWEKDCGPYIPCCGPGGPSP